jgi:hypothetical protein
VPSSKTASESQIPKVEAPVANLHA